MKTVVVIPTFNESENIANLIKRLQEVTESKIEIVVVDDSPNDLTAEVVKTIKDSNVNLIKRVKRGGRGSAVIEGFKYGLDDLKADTFVEMDADFSHDPAQLPDLLSKSKEKTVVIGSRYLKGSKIIDWPAFRFFASKISNLIIRSMLRMPIVDNTNGYRVYSQEAVKVLLNHRFLTSGYIVLSESAKVLYENGFNFVEVPITFANRRFGQSSTTVFEFMNALKSVYAIKSYVEGLKKQPN